MAHVPRILTPWHIRGSGLTRAPGYPRHLMAVTDFETKVAVIVRDDLAVWQRLNVCAFLISGVTAHAGGEAIGEPYEDADGATYLPLLVQPVVVLEATAAELQRSRERAERRGVAIAVYTSDMFETGGDDANRAVVRSVPGDRLDLVGVALRAVHRDADAVIRGLARHP